MAARHFAQNIPQIDDEPSELSQDLGPVQTHGRHFKAPAVEQQSSSAAAPAVVSAGTASAVAPTAVAPAAGDTETDDWARAYIDQLMRELAVPEPEPEPEPEPLIASVPEAPVVPEVPSLSVKDAASDSEQESVSGPRIPLVERADDSPGFWQQSAPAPVTESVADPEIQEEFDLLDKESPEESGDELESTAVLDHDAIRRAVEEQEEEDEHTEHVNTHRHERIEVGSGFYVPPNNSKSETSAELATRKPRLGFFAAIGEFIARLFHMDD